jgi:hypothetical protein
MLALGNSVATLILPRRAPSPVLWPLAITHTRFLLSLSGWRPKRSNRPAINKTLREGADEECPRVPRRADEYSLLT